MIPIKIPDTCKPTSEILYGYSGGMGLYIAHWESVELLFRQMPKEKIGCFSDYIINYSTIYN